MYKNNSKKLAFILYDGIKNSVFTSQVLQPLLNRLVQDNNLEITLISFEKQRPNNKVLVDLIPAHDRLHFVICRRLPFFGKLSLCFAVLQLKRLLRIISCDQMITRGPLAGWVALKALGNFSKKHRNNLNLQSLTIQARGLCAEEYRFACQKLKNCLLRGFCFKYIYSRLHEIEQQVYSQKSKNILSFKVKIESVSPALKEYLITNFDADSANIVIAQKDLPKKVDKKRIQKWRKCTRKKLGISDDSFVYCYAGSARPWQCLPEALQYFSGKYQKNPKSFLLLLSQDKEKIENMICKTKVPKNNCALLSAKPAELNKYLCASDAGLLFRDKDIINWVSRPTKMLEYQAVGLDVIHNHTIAWLEN